MKDVNELLVSLDIASEFGYGPSGHGFEEAGEAAERIRYLSAELSNANQVVSALLWDKTCLRAALKKAVDAIKTLGDIASLFDTVG